MSEFTNAKRQAWIVGMRESRAAWRGWCQDHFRVLIPWFIASVLIALLMLFGIWLVATLSGSEQSSSLYFIGAANPWSIVADIFINNFLVLLLHLLVCVAAYLARRSLPLQAEHMSGINSFVHRNLGPIAMVVVTAMVLYSLSFQTWEIGHGLREVANGMGMSPLAVLLRVAPHAFVELTAVFLPLAACLLLGRQGRWNDLLAATLLCTVVAVPMIALAALWEGFVAANLF